MFLSFSRTDASFSSARSAPGSSSSSTVPVVRVGATKSEGNSSDTCGAPESASCLAGLVMFHLTLGVQWQELAGQRSETDAASEAEFAPTQIPILSVSFVTVRVFLAAHVTIVLDVAFGEIPADVIIALDVVRSEVPVPV